MSDSPLPHRTSLSQLASVAVLMCGFLVACHFYGLGFNLSFLWLSSLAPLAILTINGRRGLAPLLQQSPGFVLYCTAALVLIAFHQAVLSKSPDSSFGPSWILAALPLWALSASLVNIRWLQRGMISLVAVFAVGSAFMFVVFQRRAYAPLPDPNNYVTLLYLAWIPWVLTRLNNPVGTPASWTRTGWTFFLSWCFCLSLYATESRFSLVVVAGLCLVVLFGVWRFSFSKRECAAVWLAAITGFLTYAALSVKGVAAGLAQAGGESAEGTRWHLLQSTWQALLEFGGINGTGLFTFSLFYPMVRSTAEQETTGQFVHNDYLQLALEGGIWLLLPLLVMGVLVAVRIFRGFFLSRVWDSRLNYAIALAVVFVHAMVNFVFYILPLTVMVGVWAAAVFAPRVRAGPVTKSFKQAGTFLWGGLTLVLFVNSMYLALDTFTYGVFSGQLRVPYASTVRQDPQRMLRYARFAQSINARRGIPVLAEAKLLERELAREPTALLLQQADFAFQRAIDVDPWNPSTYTSYHHFLQRYPMLRSEYDQHEPAKLLYQALELDPINLKTVRSVINHHLSMDEVTAAAAVADATLVWCERLARRQTGPLKELLGYLKAIQTQHAGFRLATDLNRCRTELDRSSNRVERPRMWLMQWLQAQPLSEQ